MVVYVCLYLFLYVCMVVCCMVVRLYGCMYGAGEVSTVLYCTVPRYLFHHATTLCSVGSS